MLSRLLKMSACASFLCIQAGSSSEPDTLRPFESVQDFEKWKASLTVVTASKAEESIDEAPNVMYVITADQIRKNGYKSLIDIFQIIPGLGVHQKDIQFVAQVRGIAPNDNDKVTLMINGHIVCGVAEQDLFQGGGFPLDNIERIEIIVGPGGVFYGGETECAIVNLITKKSDYSEIAASLGGGTNTRGAGTPPTRDVSLMAGKAAGRDASFYSAFSYYERGGYPSFRPQSAAPANAVLGSIDDVAGRVHPSYIMFLGSEIGNWSAQFFGQNSQFPELHLIGGKAADDGRRTDYICFGVIRNTHDWGRGFSTSFESSGDIRRLLRAIEKVGNGSSNYDQYDLSQSGFSADGAIKHIVANRNIFQIGIQAGFKQNRHNYVFITNPDKPYTSNIIASNGDTIGDTIKNMVKVGKTKFAGLYISDKITVNEYLKLVGALRFDRNDVLDVNARKGFADLDKVYIAPRLAILISPFESVRLKFMYNKANRLAIAPWATPHNNVWGIDNPNAPSWAAMNPMVTRPEQLSTYEAQAVGYVWNSRIGINYWFQRMTDFTSWFNPFTNVGDFEGHGIEYDISSKVHDLISVWTNGTIIVANEFTVTAKAMEKDSTGNLVASTQVFQVPSNDKSEVMAVPKFAANLGCEIQPVKNLFIDPTIRYFTKQVMSEPVAVDTVKTSAGKDSVVIASNFGYADNRAYLDLCITYEKIPLPGSLHAVLKDKIDARLLLKNITNNTKLIGTQYMQDSYHPRGMSWEFSLFVRF